MPTELSIQLAGETVQLLADRALVWPGSSTLFIADPHFGKSAGMRLAGIAVPEDIDSELGRLTRLIRNHKTKRLVILGDFFHGKLGRTRAVMGAIESWRHSLPELVIDLVRGNHDVGAGDPPGSWGITPHTEPLDLGAFSGCHHPNLQSKSYTLAGHFHPGFRWTGRNGARFKAPVFVVGEQCCILPAFGQFTGLEPIRLRPGNRLFLCGPGEIQPLDIPTV